MPLISLACFIFMGECWFQFTVVILVNPETDIAQLCPSLLWSQHFCLPLHAIQTLFFSVFSVPQKGLGKHPGQDSVICESSVFKKEL